MIIPRTHLGQDGSGPKALPSMLLSKPANSLACHKWMIPRHLGLTQSGLELIESIKNAAQSHPEPEEICFKWKKMEQ